MGGQLMLGLESGQAGLFHMDKQVFSLPIRIKAQLFSHAEIIRGSPQRAGQYRVAICPGQVLTQKLPIHTPGLSVILLQQDHRMTANAFPATGKAEPFGGGGLDADLPV
jgi:hypothetical protein